MAGNDETIRALLRTLATLISTTGEDSRMTYRISKVVNDLAKASSTGESDKILKNAAPELTSLMALVASSDVVSRHPELVNELQQLTQQVQASVN